MNLSSFHKESKDLPKVPKKEIVEFNPALPTEMGGKPFIDSFLRYLAKKQSCPAKKRLVLYIVKTTLKQDKAKRKS